MLHGENIIRYRDLTRILLLSSQSWTESHLAHIVAGIQLRDVLYNQTVHAFVLLNADPGVGHDDGVSRGQDVEAPPPDDVAAI